MSEKGVTHWKSTTPVEGKDQALCGRILNGRDLTVAKSLDEVTCQRCHAMMKLAIEDVLNAGRLQPKHVLPANIVRKLKRTYCPDKRNATKLVRDMAMDAAKGQQE